MTDEPITLVEICSGTSPFTDAAEMSPREYETFRVEIDERFEAELHKDILDMSFEELPEDVDFMVLTPPCTCLCIAALRHYFDMVDGRRKYTQDPEKREKVVNNVDILNKCLSLINHVRPTYWLIENPRATMRKFPIMEHLPRVTTWYCQYQDDFPREKRTPKPTDVFSNLVEEGLELETCKNGNEECHGTIKRGSKKGVQGKKDSVTRARIPINLCIDILRFVEYLLFGPNKSLDDFMEAQNGGG